MKIWTSRTRHRAEPGRTTHTQTHSRTRQSHKTNLQLCTQKVPVCVCVCVRQNMHRISLRSSFVFINKLASPSAQQQPQSTCQAAHSPFFPFPASIFSLFVCLLFVEVCSSVSSSRSTCSTLLAACGCALERTNSFSPDRVYQPHPYGIPMAYNITSQTRNNGAN